MLQPVQQKFIMLSFTSQEMRAHQLTSIYSGRGDVEQDSILLSDAEYNKMQDVTIPRHVMQSTIKCRMFPYPVEWYVYEEVHDITAPLLPSIQ